MTWEPCLMCGRGIQAPPGAPRFCSPECMRTWWLDRRRLAGPEVELQGVVGLICAVYAWREWEAVTRFAHRMRRMDEALRLMEQGIADLR